MAEEGFEGMGALIRDLQRLPDVLRAEAEAIVDRTADRMAEEVRTAYAGKTEGTGNLAKGVKVDKGEKAGGRLRARVRSTANHAHLFERGTVQRFTSGTGANRGTMPANPTFIPAAVRARERMVEELIDVVNKAKVSGMEGSLAVTKA